MKIRWAKGNDECGYHWAAKEGETITALDGIEGSPTKGQIITYPARGPHYCIKDFDHVEDITNDDHQCCCGHTHDEP